MSTLNNTPAIINTSAALTVALHELFSRVDFANIGQVKDHFEKVDDGSGQKVKTETVNGSFLTAQIRMPKGTPIMIEGEPFYPTTLAVKLDAFHLEGEKPTGGVAQPKAATLSNAEILRNKLRGKPDANGTIAVEAVPAK